MKKNTNILFKLKGLMLLCAVFSLTAVDFIRAHGTVTNPPSRIWNCKGEGENPTSGGCQAAASQFGTSYIYDWNGVRQGNADGNHTAVVPDGNLGSGGDPNYYGALDLVGVNWKATRVSAGPYTVTWTNSAPHKTAYYRVYITRQGWSPNQRLTWGDLELLRDTGPRGQEATANISVVLPSRSGKHVIYSVWQRSDSPEAFYSVSDVDFGGGGGGNTNNAPSVSITSPSNGSSYEVGDQVRITANASDSDGSVSSVTFFVNGDQVSSDTSAPYEYVWTAVEGNFNISARASDNDGASTTSSSVGISVGTGGGGGGGGSCNGTSAWDANEVYLSGDQVSLNSVLYEAKWWTRNQNPESNSSQWAVWKNLGNCGNKSELPSTASAIQVYPNPFTNTISLRTDGTAEKIAVKLYDIKGREVLSSENLQEGSSLDVSNLTGGIYLIQIYKDGIKDKVQRIVKN